jgi:hypothetical protein
MGCRKKYDRSKGGIVLAAHTISRLFHVFFTVEIYNEYNHVSRVWLGLKKAFHDEHQNSKEYHIQLHRRIHDSVEAMILCN